MFAWAKHAQPTELPNDVGFSLQPDEYLVLQVLSTRLISPIVLLSVFVIVSNLIAYPLQSYIANFTHYLLQDPLRWISLRSVL